MVEMHFRGEDAQMQSMMTRMTKALSMAKMEAETAVIILRSSDMRPKSRTTRRARMSLTSQEGTAL